MGGQLNLSVEPTRWKPTHFTLATLEVSRIPRPNELQRKPREIKEGLPSKPGEGPTCVILVLFMPKEIDVYNIYV